MRYWGANLAILRDRDTFPSESVDLLYFESPSKSNPDYKVLFPRGTADSPPPESMPLPIPDVGRLR